MLDSVYSTMDAKKDATDKHYKKYYQNLTEVTDEDYQIYKGKAMSLSEPSEKGFELFLEQKYGQTEKRRIKGSYILKEPYLETERFAFGIIGLVSFIILIISILSNNIQLLVSASAVFCAVWFGIFIAYLVNKTIINID